MKIVLQLTVQNRPNYSAADCINSLNYSEKIPNCRYSKNKNEILRFHCNLTEKPTSLEIVLKKSK